MASFNLSIFSFIFVFLLFVSINDYNVAFGETLDSFQNDPIEMEGYFNILEIIYADGTYDMKYYLFVDSPLANNPIPYQLEFTNPTGSLMELVSENVLVRGHIPTTAQFSNSISTVQIMADSIEKITSNPAVQSFPDIAQIGVEGTPVPSELQSHVILSKFADQAFEPHNAIYFENLFYNSTAGVYSLANYFNDTSYGNLTITSTGVHDWSTLQNNTNFFNQLSNDKIFNFTYQAITAAELAGGPIDFDGINNVTENNNQENLLKSGPNGDDIDHLFFIYNQNSFGPCNCAFAFLGPVGIQTPSNGEMFFLLSYLPDLSPASDGFAVDTSYNGGIGIPAHELGHTLGWDHTHTPNILGFTNGPYYDPWSIMSKGAQTILENPAGAIAYNKDHANWIPDEDIITIGQSQTELFNLDKLSDTSPGPGYLMAKIPFGSGNPSEFYTLEARINDIFDHTPDDKTGLLMYHVNPNGHLETFNLDAEAALVDVNGALDNTDWKNANLVLDQNFTLNNITIRYLEHNTTSITVQVENFFSPSSCSLPGGGDWTISASCTLMTSASAPANVIVQDDVVLTIPAGKTLTVPSGFSFTVNSEGRTMIELGGTLIIVS